MEQLSKKGWMLGGEQSGHIICLDRTTTGDGIVSALQVLAEINRSGCTLHELASGMTKYPQILINVRIGSSKAEEIMADDTVQDAVREIEAELASDGRVLLRPSGTEPLIRVMIEGIENEPVVRLANQLADVVKSRVI
jgi:phosphoglucosamine mutase